MGLWAGFYYNHEEMFCIDRHDLLFSWFSDQIGGKVDDVYDDFYVVEETLEEAEIGLEAWISELGITPDEIPDELPDDFDGMEPRDVEERELIILYPALLRRLRDLVYEHGYLICSYSV